MRWSPWASCLAQRRQGVALWHAFWYGANVDGEDRPSPERTATNRLAASWWGASWPSTLLATAAVGLWLLAAPAVLGTSGAAADSDHLVDRKSTRLNSSH